LEEKIWGLLSSEEDARFGLKAYTAAISWILGFLDSWIPVGGHLGPGIGTPKTIPSFSFFGQQTLHRHVSLEDPPRRCRRILLNGCRTACGLQ
jgi:hypothetical protein